MQLQWNVDCKTRHQSHKTIKCTNERNQDMTTCYLVHDILAKYPIKGTWQIAEMKKDGEAK